MMARVRLSEERGIALIMTLGTMLVTSVILVTVIQYSSAAGRGSHKSKADQTAYALAEAGVNNAMSVLANPSNNALNSTLLPPRETAYEGGTVTWSGSFSTNSTVARWTITSVSSVRNPTGPTASPVSRRIVAQVDVIPTLSQPLNSTAWNYIYSRSVNTPGGCDMTLQQSVAINSPLLVSGNLCMQNSASLLKGPVVVAGSVTMTDGNTIGTASTRVSSAAIGNGCSKANPGAASQNPCTGGAAVHIYADSMSSNPPEIPPPSVDWDAWYANANPGPYYPCTTVSGTPPAFESGDQGVLPNVDLTKRNNSILSVVDLTPASSYSCRTVGGELTWNAATKVLTVNGTMFIDGSAKIENGAVNSYAGFATIYLSGTLLIKNSSMCAEILNGACSTSNWTSNSRMLVFVVNGNGSNAGAQSQTGTGNSILLSSARFQGALYATYGIDIATTSNSDGPLDGAPVKVGQTVNSTWPAFTVVPSGMPGNPVAYAEPQAPVYEG
jgi:Tfp pilus assembly protein PilV